MKGMALAGWVAVGLALFVSMWLDFNNAVQGGAIDLRNRITGTRVLERHVDPYHYKWHRPEPEELCDLFNNPNLPVSKTTNSPTLLAINIPLGLLPYRYGQLLWFVLQWLLLLGTGALWLFRCRTETQRWLLALLITGFTYTAAWRLHAERGQTYILLAFLFSLWLTVSLDLKRTPNFLAGFIAGFLITLRPPFALLLPFVALHRRGQLIGAAAGLAAGIVLPLFWLPGCWSDYYSGMQAHSEIYRTDFSPHGVMAWPREVEGLNSQTLLGFYVPIPYADYSVHALLKTFGAEPVSALLVLLAAIIPFGLWLVFTRRTENTLLFGGLAAWFFLIDLFLPAYRNSYTDVMILAPAALAILATPRPHWAIWPCLLALPIGIWVYVTLEDTKWLINLPAILFTLGAVLLLFPSPWKQASAPAPVADQRRKKRR